MRDARRRAVRLAVAERDVRVARDCLDARGRSARGARAAAHPASPCVEAGKSLVNAQGEVREAADFCRYYAAQARRELRGTTPRGPDREHRAVELPLAIFVGQVSAALAAGNPVIAKPAEQTPLIAAHAVRLLHEAGVPATALQLLPGAGDTAGAALVADPRIAGVLFTGSTEVARLIAQNARRGAPTIPC
jgi:RHH-type proline utilization regulon transcriptional repressor/proline dehydrogenase/delta 1-pyrroline-5-carboxylate dehydrogenase